MLSMLLVAGGLALACAGFLWNVVGSYDEDHHQDRNGKFVVFAMWAACGNVGMTLALLKHALPGHPGMGFGLLVLAAGVLVCALCLMITAFSYDDLRHHGRNFHLLMIAVCAAYLSMFAALLMILAVLELVEIVGILALIVATFIGVIGFLTGEGHRSTPRGDSGSGYDGSRGDSGYDGYGDVSGDGGEGGGGD
ncbi:hypothetical protein [Nocardiopsis dassonvillei]|uniref:hypothetical protein n=1 Tax=Nocardiopsis dassonvillei TaxID=2014 RepID=UPI0033F66E19